MREDSIRVYHCAMPRINKGANAHLMSSLSPVKQKAEKARLAEEKAKKQAAAPKKRSKKKSPARKPGKASSDAKGSDTNPVKESDDDTKSSKA